MADGAERREAALSTFARNAEIERDRNVNRRQKKQQRKKVPRKKSALKGRRVSALPTFKTQLERPETNERQWIVLEPNFHHDTTKDSTPQLPQGSNGVYRATFVLGIPGKEAFLDDLDVDTLRQSGTSLLLMPPGVPFARVNIIRAPDNQEMTEIMFAASKDGRVANAQVRIQASNFTEAEREAFNLVMPILSRWSYEHDVALDLKFYEIVEEQTLVQKLGIGLVGKAKPLGINISGLSKPEFRVIFAAYREAINQPMYSISSFASIK